jgi:hypothetical protein
MVGELVLAHDQLPNAMRRIANMLEPPDST